MSALVIYAFYRDGDAFQYRKVRNSWGGGFSIWEILTEKYKYKRGRPGVEEFRVLWDKCTAGDMDDLDTVCCLFTFDWVWVKRENTARLAEQLLTFKREHDINPPTLSGVWNILLDASKDDNIIGVAFNMSNCGTCLWYSWSDEADEDVPYNVLKGDDHWELFEEFDKIRAG